MKTSRKITVVDYAVIAVVAFGYLFYLPCDAIGWELHSETNRMTDEARLSISTKAKSDPNNLRLGKLVNAEILVSCPGDYFLTQILFDEPVGLGTIDFAYRLDDYPRLSYDDLLMSDSGRSAVLFPLAMTQAAKHLLSKNRLRIEMRWRGDNPAFFDFDLSGGKEALEKLKCNDKAMKELKTIKLKN